MKKPNISDKSDVSDLSVAAFQIKYLAEVQSMGIDQLKMLMYMIDDEVERRDLKWEYRKEEGRYDIGEIAIKVIATDYSKYHHENSKCSDKRRCTKKYLKERTLTRYEFLNRLGKICEKCMPAIFGDLDDDILFEITMFRTQYGINYGKIAGSVLDRNKKLRKSREQSSLDNY